MVVPAYITLNQNNPPFLRMIKVENEDKCGECGSPRGTNIYCWHCPAMLKPWIYPRGIVKQSESSDNAKKIKDGLQAKVKRISKRTRNKDGRFRKKRSDIGKPRRKKNEL